MKRSTKNDRLRDEAKRAMWLYYKEHKSWMPEWIREFREEIIEEIRSGRDPAVIFNEIIDRVDAEVAQLSAA